MPPSLSPLQDRSCPVDLAVVVPAYNEEKNIAAVLGEWSSVFGTLGLRFQMLVVDDGSRDGTAAAVRKMSEMHPGILLRTKANSGHGPSCRAGYEWALGTGAPWVLQIDSDGQCDPIYFSEFWPAREEADAVFGVRTSRDDGLARTVTSALCRLGTLLWTGASLRDPNVPYRLMRAEALRKALDRVPQDFFIQNVALTLALSRERGLRWKYFPIHFRNRAGGVNSINLRAVAKAGLQMLRELKRVQ